MVVRGLHASPLATPSPFPQLDLCCCFLYYLGYCFPLQETTVFKFVLVPLLLAVLISNSNSAFTASAIYW
jgi:hypothetical protein